MSTMDRSPARPTWRAGDPPLDRGGFLAVIAAAVPLARNVGLDSRIAELPPDALSRVALRGTVSHLLPGAPSDLLASIDRLEDAYDWHHARNASAGHAGQGPDSTGSGTSSRIALRPLRDDDLGRLFLASTEPSRGYRWRYRGATPGPQEFHAQLHAGVLAQFVVERVSDQSPRGLVCCYDARLEQGSASVGLVGFHPDRGRGEVFEGFLSFIDFVFRTWPLRKLQAEVPGFNAAGLFDEADPLIEIEGRFVDHCFADGRWWDQLVIAIWRHRWVEHRYRFPFLAEE